jgi:hypothetical protein
MGIGAGLITSIHVVRLFYKQFLPSILRGIQYDVFDREGCSHGGSMSYPGRPLVRLP